MAIWEWAIGVYARPGVAETCLRLQDDHAQNVPLLLWAAWARAADPQQLARAAATARNWEAMAVGPLHAVRRALKPAAPPVDDVARERLRSAVKAAELQAERVLLETLEALATDRPTGAPSALEALRAASAAWGPPASDNALAALARALS